MFGNVSVRELAARLDELLTLTVEAGDTWEEAITHNDIACYLEQAGDTAGARKEIYARARACRG